MPTGRSSWNSVNGAWQDMQSAPWRTNWAKDKQASEERRHQERAAELRSIMQSRLQAGAAVAESPTWATVVKSGDVKAQSERSPSASPLARTYTPAEIMDKKKTAYGIRDLKKLIASTEDQAEAGILNDCMKRLQEKAKGEMQPAQRLEEAMLALADAQARAKRAEKHLQEAQELHSRAVTALDAAKKEMLVAEELEAQRKQEEERQRSRSSSPASPTSPHAQLNTHQLLDMLADLQKNLQSAPINQQGQVVVDSAHLSNTLMTLQLLAGHSSRDQQCPKGTRPGSETPHAGKSASRQWTRTRPQNPRLFPTRSSASCLREPISAASGP